ncbi:MAG: four helix bundle protein [Deltaproteobacteria bacterium]|nr:four helix bundle protein [Deltaproteobacteria bacterium]
MSSLKSFRELIVWQKSVDLVEKIYRETRSLPKEEIYGLTGQMRRAAVSIPSNIAEGQSRNSTGEFRQFLGISKGSLAELETQIEVAGRLKYLTSQQLENLLRECMEIGKMLNGLMRSLF